MKKASDWAVLVAKQRHPVDLARFVTDEDGTVITLAGLAILDAALEADHDHDGSDFIAGFAAGICRLVFARYGWDRTLFIDEWHDRAPVIEAPEPDWWSDGPPEGWDTPPSLKDGFTRDYAPWEVRLP